MLPVSLNVRKIENSAGWTTYGTFLVVVLSYQALLRRRISTASGSERPLAKATLATARGTDPVDALQNNLVSKALNAL